MTAPADLIRPPKHIKDKVPATGGPDPRAAIMRALNSAGNLIDDYQGWAVDDLEALRKAFQDAARKSSVEHPEDIAKMYDIAHEVRGQGGTFGFPLISAIGDSLCRFLDGRKSLGERELDVVEIHILAMKAVFRQKLKGEPGALGRELRTLFRALCLRVDPTLKYDD